MKNDSIEQAINELKESGFTEISTKDVLDIVLSDKETDVEEVIEMLTEAGIKVIDEQDIYEELDFSSPITNLDVFENTKKENYEEEQIYLQYIKDISMYEVLTPEKEHELLVKAAAGNKDAREKLIKCNLRLVVHNAQKYRNRGIPLLDLIQEGNIGLMTAVDKFDYRKGFRFTTYATWWILQKIRRAVMEKGGMIRIPVYLVVQIKKISKATKMLTEKYGVPPTVEQLMEATGYSEHTIRNIAKIPTCNISIDTPLSDDSQDTLMHILPDDSQLSVDDIVQELFLKDEVNKSLQVLTQKERDIIMMYYGLTEDGVQYSLQAIGEKYGLTRERIRQIKELAINKLRLNHALRDLIA